ncbi:MAG: VWA domain-containing protein [Candidatus Sulfotelmatobacter sp.]
MTSFPALSRGVLACLTLFCFSAALLTAQSDAPPAQAQDAAPAQNSGAAPTKLVGQTAPAPPSNDAQEPSMTIRQTVQRVIVDVMVQDANGKPVHGLKADDFSVTEDKQPQRVLSFDVYDFDKPSISRAPNAPPLPPHVFENIPAVPERGPLYVMLLDLVDTEVEDQMRGRQQVLKFIRNKPAGTRFAVFVTSDKLYLVQGFTDDKDLLYTAVNSKKPKAHIPRVFLLARNYGYGDPYTAVDMLTHIGDYLDGIPGRKNLIWVAGTFPLSPSPQEGNSPLADNVKAEINSLAHAQVAVFPVDVTGVDPNPAVSNLNASQASEETIASATGGRAVYSDNGVADVLSTVTEEGGNYYTLTYSPPNHGEDDKCHNISVKVGKEKYQLSYRHNYCRGILVSTAADENGNHSSSPTLEVPVEAGDVLQANIKPGAPMLHDLMFSTHIRTSGVGVATPAQMAQLQEQAAFFQTQRKNKPVRPLPPVKVQTYAIDYRVLDPAFKAQAARTGQPPALEFAVAAFDDDGKVLNGVVNDGVPETSTQPSENKAGLYRVHQSLLVPVTAKSLRVGVRDRLNDRMGTLEVDLPLPPESVSRAAMPPKPAH